MKKRSLIAASCFVMAGTWSACSQDVTGPEIEPDPPRVLSAAEQQLVAADNAFGLDLFVRLDEWEHGQDGDPSRKNIFVSPLSVSMALGMTLNGASGETRQQLQNALHLAGMSSDEINAAYRDLIDLLTGLDPRVALEIANSIWHEQSFDVGKAFLETSRTYFDAEIHGLDFRAPESVDRINGWVDEKTKGKIESIIESIPADAVMYLINAVYFKGVWLFEFDEENTRPDKFMRLDGTEGDIQMMGQEGTLAYTETADFQAVDLPYGDSLFSMSVFLPKPSVHIDSLVRRLDGQTWDEWTAGFAPRDIILQLPRFELEYKVTLNDVIRAMGAAKALTAGGADFSGINSEVGRDLYISRVLHKTFVEVNEEGTEAAAVTAVEISRTSVGGKPVMRIDRPFLFAIRENHTGTILFLGKVMDLSDA